MGEAIQKNVGTIALVVGIIALVSSLIPQVENLMQDFCREEAAANITPGNAGPGGAPRGGMMPGMGGPGGGFGGGPRGGMQPSKATLDKMTERLALYDAALKTAKGEELLKLRCERDLAKLASMRMEQGGRRILTGPSEAFIKKSMVFSQSTSSALDKNQAELDYLQALDRMRGDKEAFIGTVEAFKDYPAKAVTDEDLVTLLAAEMPQMP